MLIEEKHILLKFEINSSAVTPRGRSFGHYQRTDCVLCGLKIARLGMEGTDWL